MQYTHMLSACLLFWVYQAVFEQELRAGRLMLGETCRLKLINQCELVGQYEPLVGSFSTMRELLQFILEVVVHVLQGIYQMGIGIASVIRHPALTCKKWFAQPGDVISTVLGAVIMAIASAVYMAFSVLGFISRVAWWPVQIMALVGMLAEGVLRTKAYNSKENRDCVSTLSKDGKWLIVV
jgi:hypothetical protein